MKPQNPATLASLQAQAKAFCDARDWAQFHSPRNLAMALSVEANELLALYLWSTDQGPQPPQPQRAQQVEDEAADVLICLLNFAERAGIDLQQAFEHKLASTQEKYPVEKSKGRALKYNEFEHDD